MWCTPRHQIHLDLSGYRIKYLIVSGPEYGICFKCPILEVISLEIVKCYDMSLYVLTG